MKKFLKKKIKELLWGKKNHPYSLSKQLSRVITYCCVIAVTIQAIVMVGIIISQYIQQGREDTFYILENDNGRMETKIQYLEEVVLTIQHNLGMRGFFTGQLYSKEATKTQLENSVSVFAERNRMENSEPFIEKIYLFNRKGESICQLYYPITVLEYDAYRRKYEKMQRVFKESKENFYYQVEEKHINLCLYLYDENMENMGSCILVLNREGIENNYKNIESMGDYSWSIKQEDKVILEKNSLRDFEKKYILENTFDTGFGLTFSAAISEFVIFKSLWTSIFITVLTAIILIVILIFFAHILSLYYVKPLKIVAEKIRQVGRGNFDTKLEEHQVEELKQISETFNEMTDYIHHLIREVYETQLIAKQSQIQYLQAQMNPHFLFNVLSMIGMKAAINQDHEVKKLIYQLSKLYQGKIFRKNEPVISLMEEMEIAEFYLSIQNSRFGEKITYSIEYTQGKEKYENLMVPRLSIEPIVENAVCHGLEPKEGNGHISIAVSVSEEILKIIIADDGIGFDPKSMENKEENKDHTHVGIWNTNKMIHNLYGEEYGLTVESKVGEGTRVEVKLPVRRGNEYVESYDC